MARWAVRMAGVVACLAALPACGGGDSSDQAASTRSTAATSTTSTSAPVEEIASTTAPSGSPPSTAATGSPTTTARRPAGSSTTTRSGGGASPDSPRDTIVQPNPTTTRPAPSASIAIRNFTFDPAVLNVAAGTRVTATNFDSAPHTWTSTTGAWDSGQMSQNQSFTHTFATPGTFAYRCTLHPSMTGTVNVS